VDKGILTDQSTIDFALDFLRGAAELELVQMDRARAELVVNERIVVHDFHVQVEFGQVIGQVGKDEGFTVDGVLGAAFLGTLLRTVVLVQEDAVLFELKDHEGIALADEVIIVQVGDLVEEDSQLSHGTVCCLRFDERGIR
jgi:hypothetical protein